MMPPLVIPCTHQATFLSRPNRFTGIIQLLPEGAKATAHIPNPGRMARLLQHGTRVLLARASTPRRKTSFDLVAAYQGHTLVSIDSRIPNKIVHKAIQCSAIPGLSPATTLVPEHAYRESRFDFYLEENNTKHLVEVKSCTLVEKGVALFPDAPTKRGQRHLRELLEAAAEGCHAHVIFVVQRPDARVFKPNEDIDPEFARLIGVAANNNVSIHAYTCNVQEERRCLSISLAREIPVKTS